MEEYLPLLITALSQQIVNVHDGASEIIQPTISVLCIYLVYFCFPEPRCLLSGEEYLNCHLLSPPLGQPDLTIPVTMVSHNTSHGNVSNLLYFMMYQCGSLPALTNF